MKKLLIIIVLLWSCTDRQDCTLVGDITKDNVWEHIEIIDSTKSVITTLDFSGPVDWSYYQRLYVDLDSQNYFTYYEFRSISYTGDSLFLYKLPAIKRVQTTRVDTLRRKYIGQKGGIDCSYIFIDGKKFEVFE